MVLPIDLYALVDTSKPSLLISLFSITIYPFVWNIIARNEYRSKTITRIFGGNPYYGCYFLAVMMFSSGLLRDHLFSIAILGQPQTPILPQPYATLVPAGLFVLGPLLLITAIWALGITGAFMGDYFGILLDRRVEGFPFNVLENPMYVGSTMCFVAMALWDERPAGLFIALYVYIVYYAIVLLFERPFTTMIYSERSNGEKVSKKAN